MGVKFVKLEDEEWEVALVDVVGGGRPMTLAIGKDGVVSVRTWGEGGWQACSVYLADLQHALRILKLRAL